MAGASLIMLGMGPAVAGVICAPVPAAGTGLPVAANAMKKRTLRDADD
jgi:hypothetical protein